MKKKIYISPDIMITDYAPGSVIAMSWSDEETGEALAGERDSDDSWDSFWDYRE